MGKSSPRLARYQCKSPSALQHCRFCPHFISVSLSYQAADHACSSHRREQRKEERLETCPFPKCQFSTEGLGFAYSSEVSRHIRAKHKSEIKDLSTAEKARFNLVKNPPKKYLCKKEGCLKGYGRPDHLLRHRTIKHGRVKQKRGRQARR